MAIITSVPAIGSIVKGSPATFTLSKAQLLLVPSVAGSTYYSDSGNWKAVVLNYMSDPLNQPEVVGFDATQVTPTGIFDVVLSALDVFNIQSISIIDFQGGVFTVPRSELTVAEFDIDMGPQGFPFVRDFSIPNTLEAYESDSNSVIDANALNMTSGTLYANKNADILYALGASYTFRFHVESFFGGYGLIVYSSSSHYIDSVLPETIAAAVGSSFDVTFNANASDVGSITKLSLLSTSGTYYMKFSKIEIIQNP